MKSYASTEFRRIPKDMLSFLDILLKAIRSDCSNTTINEMMLFLSNHFKLDYDDAKRTVQGKAQPCRVIYLLNFHDYIDSSTEAKNRGSDKVTSLDNVESDTIFEVFRTLVHMESLAEGSVSLTPEVMSTFFKCLHMYYTDILHLQYIFSSLQKQLTDKVNLDIFIAPEIPIYLTEALGKHCNDITSEQILGLLDELPQDELRNRIAFTTGIGADDIPVLDIWPIWTAYMATSNLEVTKVLALQCFFVLQSEFWRFDSKRSLDRKEFL